ACYSIQNQDRNFAANDGSDLKQLFCIVLQTINPGRNNGLHRRGKRNRINTTSEAISSPLTFKNSTFDQSVDQLLQKERISLRPLYDVSAQQRQRSVATKMILYQNCRLCGRQRPHVDLSIVRSLHQGCRKAGPEIYDQKGSGPHNSVSQGFN